MAFLCRRWPNIEPTPDQCFVFAGYVDRSSLCERIYIIGVPKTVSILSRRNFTDQGEMKCNESGFRPRLCTCRLNWARKTSWGWWDEWDDTVLQTRDSKCKPWRSEPEHATSRLRSLPTIRVLRVEENVSHHAASNTGLSTSRGRNRYVRYSVFSHAIPPHEINMKQQH